MITDLTGTTWCLNHELNISETEITYNINFTSEGSGSALTSFTLLIEEYNGQDDHCLVVNGTYWYDVVAYAHNWLGYTKRVWVITGGADSTNQSLINWLQNNATQIYVTSLLNTQWVISDTPETYVKYSWSGTETAVSSSLDFNILSDEDTVYHSLTWQTSTALRYYMSTTTSGTYLTAYNNGWVDDSYRYVNITGGDNVSSSFICAWFQTNAIPYVKPPEYIDKVVLTSGDEYYLKDSISGYIAESDLVAGNNIQISATSEGVSISKVNSDQVRFRFIRYPKPPEPLLDLTGTSWYLNDNPSFEGFITGYIIHNVLFFNAVSGDSCTSINLYYIPQTGLGGIVYEWNSTTSVVYDTDNGWSNGDLYRSIEFTGGDDITDTALISWLEANATRIS